MRIFTGDSSGRGSNDSGVVDEDIFGYFGGYFFGSFRKKASTADKDQRESRDVAGNHTMSL